MIVVIVKHPKLEVKVSRMPADNMTIARQLTERFVQPTYRWEIKQDGEIIEKGIR